MNLNKLQEIVRDSEGRYAVVHGLQRVGHDWAAEQCKWHNALVSGMAFSPFLQKLFSELTFPLGHNIHMLKHKEYIERETCFSFNSYFRQRMLPAIPGNNTCCPPSDTSAVLTVCPEKNLEGRITENFQCSGFWPLVLKS